MQISAISIKEYNAPQVKQRPAFGVILRNDLPILKKPFLCVMSGPSGAGKDSVLHRFNEYHPDYFQKVVTYTTRPMRKGDVNGVDYHFITLDEFKKGIERDEFLEFENVYGDTFYGSKKQDVQNALNSGKNVIMVIDVLGAATIKQKMKDAVSLFILPPSFEELAQRLIKRGSESEKTLKVRLAKADWEMSLSKNFDAVVRNDNLSESAKDLEKIFNV